MTALHDYEGRVKMYTLEFCERLSEPSEKSVNITALSRYFSFDVMGDFAFGHSFDMMRNGKNHFAVDLLRQGMAVIGPLTPVPWLFIIGKSLPGLASKWKQMLAWTTAQLRSRMEVRRCVSILHHPEVRKFAHYLEDRGRYSGCKAMIHI